MTQKILLIIFAFLAFNGFSQDVNVGPQGAALVDCANLGHLYDSGGSAGDYSAGESFVLTICPTGTTPLALEFLSANFGNPTDFLAIYDGAATVNSVDLMYSFSQSSLPNINTILRTTITNISGCITIQFVSNAASTGGNFDFNILCLPPCKSVVADVPTTSIAVLPNDTHYINSCLGDQISFTGNGIYDTNTSLYTQSDATSNFYWDFAGAGLDTGITVTKSFNPGIYSVKLIVEDVSGCQSVNEINLKIRQTLIPDVKFRPSDTTLCLNDEFALSPYLITTSGEILMVGDTAVYDTLKVQTKVSIQDTSYLPDDADNISGNGITTPAVFDFPIYGYQPGATLQNVNDLFYVCIDIEHSFIGDLDIIIECPNGQTVTLVDFSPPGTPSWNLGEPVFGTTPGQQGVPYTYCWSPSANVQDSIAEGNTQIPLNLLPNGAVDTSIMYSPPGNDWGNLLGCPLNGIWTIQVFDDYGGDDGYVFGAAIEFDGSFALEPDTFIVSYLNPTWNPSSQILTNINNDSIEVKALNNPFQTLTFNFEDNLGCTWNTDFDAVTISTVEVLNVFQDTTLCAADSLDILATILNAGSPCDYTLAMYDQFGDSWSGNSISILVDGLVVGVFDVNLAEGDSSIETFSVADGSQIQIQFNDTGSFLFEVTYNLLDPNGNLLFSDGPNPSGGIVFTTIANCFDGLTFNWSPTSEIISTSGNQASIYPTTDTEYYVEVVNEFGCVAYDTSNVFFDATQKPNLDLSTMANQFCCEGTELTVNLDDYVSAQPLNTSYWNGTLINGNNFTFTSEDFTEDTMTVNIRIIADNGCFEEETINLYKYCLNPSIEVVDSIFVGDSKVFDLSLTEYDNMSYAWSTDASAGAIIDKTVQDATFIGLYEGVYVATATATATFNQADGSVLQCVDSAEAKNYEVIDILELQYFDAFTPNSGDELNNYFRPILSEYAEILDFRIYNRWGSLVYNYANDESKNGWDGKVNGVDQEAGVYTYFMKIKHFDDEFTKESIVNLLR